MAESTPVGSEPATDRRRTGDAGTDSVVRNARAAQQSTGFRVVVGVGLVMYGLVHLIVSWIALRVAWSGSGEQADQRGALAELADTPMGGVLLWITAIGLAGLAVWQVLEALWGHRYVDDEGKRTRRRVASAGKAVLYGALSVSAVRVALGTGGESGDKEEGLTARLLSAPAGRVLVIAVGIAVIAVGIAQVRRGVKRKFTRDLEGGVRPGVIRLGQIGFIAKGTVLVVIGGLFGWAAIQADPEQAGGMDDALRTIGEAPFGSVLLTLVALGLATFGVYCFAWARRARQ